MSDQDTFALLVQEAARVLSPLRVAISSRQHFKTFMARLGWTADDIPQPLQDLSADLDTLITRLKAVTDGDVGIAALDALRQAVVDVIDSVKAISTAPDGLFPPHFIADNFKAEFPAQLVTYLLVEYLSVNHPTAVFALRALGVIERRYEPPTGNRRPFIRDRFQFSNLSQVLEDPSVVFRNAFGWGTDNPDYDSLFEQLDNLLIYLGLAVFRSEIDESIARKIEEGIDQPGNPRRSVLRAVFFERTRTDGSRLAAELDFLPLPGDQTTKPGLALMPFFNGVQGFRMQLGNEIAVMIDASFDLKGGVGLIFRPEQDLRVLLGFDSDAAPASAEGEIVVRAEYASESGDPIVIIGSSDGSRLEVRNVSGTGGLRLTTATDKQEIFSEFELQGGRLVIDTGKGDGFLQRILPAGGFSANLELTVGLSSINGFYFRGSGGLEVQLPAHINLGPVDIESLVIGLRPESGAIRVDLGANVKAELGPLTAVVEELGLRATLSFPDSGGNLGVADLDIGFKPPTGVRLSIDGGGFKGGGGLSFDPENARYTGMLELQYQNRIDLKAIGLLTTRMPDGSKGFSLLIIITSEFTPVQLGLGFTLNGVGGLLGLNRTALVERLRTGLHDNTLQSILFPQDVIANADRIVSDLRQVFPPQQGRFIFGPMARIGWGTPTLITADIGLLIELPQPVRVFILGVVKALLPDERAKLLRLQVNFLGVIDFEREQFSFDASLFDSTLLSFTLAGDMAVRMNWGDSDPNFLVTVGGFHPAYEPPPLDLPVLKRLTLQLLSADNPRLTLETYFAVTSNTAQFGARLELYASASKFNVYGFLSFDALFQFNPFYFTTDIGAMLALRIGSSNIASIKLSLTLEGPTPWKAQGTAKFKICWFFTLKVRFNKTFGEQRDTRLDDVAVLPLLAAALSDRNNWESKSPTGRNRLVSLKKIESTGDEVIADPSGVLSITQKVVPFNVAIQRFGNQQPADGNLFAIEQVRMGEAGDAETLSTSPVQEQFAPAQFFEKSDAEKLSSKSFERFDSGVRLNDSERLDATYAAKRDIEYELYYIDGQRDLAQWFEPFFPDQTAFNIWATGGAVASSPLSFANNSKSALAPEAVQVSQEHYAVVNVDDLTIVNDSAVRASEAAGLALMRDMIRNNPGLEGNLQVVPTFEVNRL
jgi:hypothetical protein